MELCLYGADAASDCYFLPDCHHTTKPSHPIKDNEKLSKSVCVKVIIIWLCEVKTPSSSRLHVVRHKTSLSFFVKWITIFTQLLYHSSSAASLSMLAHWIQEEWNTRVLTVRKRTREQVTLPCNLDGADSWIESLF